MLGEPGAQLAYVGEQAVAQVAPEGGIGTRALRRGEQALRVAVGLERLEPDVRALQRLVPRGPGGLPAGELGGVGGHPHHPGGSLAWLPDPAARSRIRACP